MYTRYSMSPCGGGGQSADGASQGMAGGGSAAKIVSALANVVR